MFIDINIQSIFAEATVVRGFQLARSRKALEKALPCYVSTDLSDFELQREENPSLSWTILQYSVERSIFSLPDNAFR